MSIYCKFINNTEVLDSGSYILWHVSCILLGTVYIQGCFFPGSRSASAYTLINFPSTPRTQPTNHPHTVTRSLLPPFCLPQQSWNSAPAALKTPPSRPRSEPPPLLLHGEVESRMFRGFLGLTRIPSFSFLASFQRVSSEIFGTWSSQVVGQGFYTF